MTTKEILFDSFSEVKKKFIYYLLVAVFLYGLNEFFSYFNLDLLYMLFILVFLPFINLEFYHSIKENRKSKFINMVRYKNSRPLVMNLLESFYLLFWYLLFFIPGMYKTLSYTLAIKFVSEDDEIGYNDALKKSDEEMKGLKSPLFIAQLCVFLPLFFILFMLTFPNEMRILNGESNLADIRMVNVVQSVIIVLSSIISLAFIPVFYAKYDKLKDRNI
ncbi:hypothetical protein [Helcococcus kunzii]|uniref:hypothetical protein n=1 Tax=Helcococcus kunzii TaxID=40091 RepID=UPI0021A662FB|nr:hypothetical protein [Helcococcus kunzii]MCT1795870.1 hypothetical protein [Helcococcus kunzii]MCT1988578.1 hypothetical protein [Helcococcus kunzii]